MAINVICRGCHARFTVSDKFAGKKGPCPKCKKIIEVPKADEQVVVHEPEHSEMGARGVTGELVLKPIERQEKSVQPVVMVGFGAGAVMALVIALVFRGVEDKSLILAIGALVVAPPLAWAGYLMLKNDEQLDSFKGVSLWTRTAICSVLYALLWGVFAYIYGRFLGDTPLEPWSAVMFGPPFFFLGAAVAYCCYDLDWGSGFFHYALYLVVTIVLRMTMGLPPAGPAAKTTEIPDALGQWTAALLQWWA